MRIRSRLAIPIWLRSGMPFRHGTGYNGFAIEFGLRRPRGLPCHAWLRQRRLPFHVGFEAGVPFQCGFEADLPFQCGLEAECPSALASKKWPCHRSLASNRCMAFHAWLLLKRKSRDLPGGKLVIPRLPPGWACHSIWLQGGLAIPTCRRNGMPFYGLGFGAEDLPAHFGFEQALAISLWL